MFLVGGTSSGRLMVWLIGTGSLLVSFEAHYKRVTSLLFTDDDAWLLSAGDDGTIAVWDWADMLAAARSTGTRPQPQASWSDHALGVTALHCGAGGTAARVYSASHDRTVRVWDLSCLMQLAAISLPSALTAVCADPQESTLLAGGADGVVYLLDLAPKATALLDPASAAQRALRGHSQRVSALACSLDGALALSGSDDGTVIVWDLRSFQSVRVFSDHAAPVSNVRVLLRPRDVFGEAGDEAPRHGALAPLRRYIGHVAPAAHASLGPVLAATLSPVRLAERSAPPLAVVLGAAAAEGGPVPASAPAATPATGVPSAAARRTERMAAPRDDEHKYERFDGETALRSADRYLAHTAKLEAQLEAARAEAATWREQARLLYDMCADKVLREADDSCDLQCELGEGEGSASCADTQGEGEDEQANSECAMMEC